MKPHRLLLAVAAVLLVANGAQAAKVFESATVGPATGVSNTINDDRFLGVRFQHTGGTIDVGSLGGHFLGQVFGPTTIFGALVELTSINDNPDSVDLSTADVLGTATLQLDQAVGPNSDVHMGFFSSPITLQDNGFYAIVFGSGLFGADSQPTSAGGATENNPNSFNSTAFRVDVSGNSFVDLPSNAEGFYFFLDTDTQIVPEPASALMSLLAALGLAGYLTRRGRRQR